MRSSVLEYEAVFQCSGIWRFVRVMENDDVFQCSGIRRCVLEYDAVFWNMTLCSSVLEMTICSSVLEYDAVFHYSGI